MWPTEDCAKQTCTAAPLTYLSDCPCCSCGGGEAAEQQQLGPIQLLDAAAVELLEACGRVIHDNRLTKCITAELLRPDEAAPAPAAQPPAAVPQLPCSFVKLLLRVPDTLLQPGAWKRSPAAATVFKQLYPCDVELGRCQGQLLMDVKNVELSEIFARQQTTAQGLYGYKADAQRNLNPWHAAVTAAAGVAVQQAMLPRQAAHQQQQQGQEGSAAAAAASAARYTLLSCFRELPSVNTAPPPMAISIQQTQAPQQPQQMPQQQQLQGVQPQQEQEQQLQPQPAAAGVTASDAVPAPPASSSSGGSTSLADVPAEVMGQLLSLLTARDLAALASTCRGLRAATWEAVPGLRLVLYPHQRNALSWMLHREVNGGGEMPHPFVRSAVTGGEAGGWTVYLNQVCCEECCCCRSVGALGSSGRVSCCPGCCARCCLSSPGQQLQHVRTSPVSWQHSSRHQQTGMYVITCTQSHVRQVSAASVPACVCCR